LIIVAFWIVAIVSIVFRLQAAINTVVVLIIIISSLDVRRIDCECQAARVK